MAIRSLALSTVAFTLLTAGCTSSGADSASANASDGSSSSAPAARQSSATPTPTGATSTPSVTASPLIEDGKNFAFVRSVDTSTDPPTVTYDLAYFLTGDAATQAAKTRGDEVPPPNDYYIVDDNPRLRTVDLSPSVRIALFDWNNCCDATVNASVDEFAHAVNAGKKQTTVRRHLFNGRLSPYWLFGGEGTIVRIEEQFLP